MKEFHLKALSIVLPSLLVLMFVLTYYNADSPAANESNYKLALKMHEQMPKSQAAVVLASDIISNQIDRTRVSYLDIFNDKFSLPQEQLSHIIEELESEHKEIIYQHHSDGIKINKILELKPRYRLVLATYLNLDPSDLNSKDISESELSNLEVYLLKTFANSEDLILLLRGNRLNQEYVQIDNLKRIYGSNHHAEDNKREVSSEK